MQSAGSAEGGQREPAGVVTALDRNHADGFFHGGIDDPNHSGSEWLQPEGGFLMLQPFADDAAGALKVELKVATEKAVGLQAAEDEVGIRNGGQGSASVADGTWISAGGFRSHAQRAGGVEAGQGSASGAYGVNVEHRNGYGQSGNFGLAAGARLAVDQSNVGGGTAHVKGDDPIESAASCGGRGSDHATGWTGENRAHGLAGGSG